ncbi:hypothetical protein RND71_022183 [Anisodus tanguticus]|uniref:SKP1 component POZ domain-containing protein n=1 Tax=Anisodus tanguticus TaxID=243964 RepID=A0AAE1RWK2_9SOLA|nr:hypothetical protein RND71_022183 [Anisodus tanguticus]
MASSSVTTSQESKILILKSSEGVEFQMEESIVVQSGTIKNMVEDDCTVFPLSSIDTKILIKIMEYMKKHVEKTDSNEDEIKTFNKEFEEADVHKEHAWAHEGEEFDESVD